MKTTIKFGLLAMFLTATIVGCSDMQNPVDVPEATSTSSSLSQFQISNPLNGNPGQFGRNYETTVLITAAGGGTLKVGFTINNGPNQHPTQVQANLTFPPGALDTDREITMSVNDFDLTVGLDLKMGPSGLKFKKPALLTLNTLNFNVSQIQQHQYQFYSVSGNNGNVEPMKFQSLNMNAFNGKITLQKGEVPHFSRYAFGRQNSQ